MIDAHVHLFPDRLADALRAWFDGNAWTIRYRSGAEELVRQLVAGGVHRMVALPYAHKPGMAEALNAFTLDFARQNPAVVPCCTVFPGEPEQERILEEALGPGGAAGIKLHCHVMRIAPDDPRVDAAWRASARHRKPLVIHGGREPAYDGYGIDVHTVSGAERIRRALERHPDAIAVVPHLGGDEYEAFEALLDDFPNLYLDTAMVLAGFFPKGPDLELLRRRPERILYGTDFPNLPYEWDRELRVIRSLGLPPEAERLILGGNAQRLFRIA